MIEAAEYARAQQKTESPSVGHEKESVILQKLVQRKIEEVNTRLSSTESIKRFAILDRDFEIEKDEVTPTGKVKRGVVTAHYLKQIESLYV
jgi:long-chain acyl-CoA synthetase